MPLLKDDKKQLAKKYFESLGDAKNIVILKPESIPVNANNQVKMDVAEAQGKTAMVKKRVFLKAIEGSYEGVSLDDLDGSVVLLYSYNDDDEHAPLKVINKYKKKWKKEKEEFGFSYVGGWYEKVRQDADYVGELAALPSKEELVGKFLFMLNHPVSSFARVLQAIADKSGTDVDAKDGEEKKEDQIAIAKEESVVEDAGEASADADQQEKTEEQEEENQEAKNQEQAEKASE